MANPKSIGSILSGMQMTRPRTGFVSRAEGEVMTREQILPYWEFFVSLGKMRTPNFKCDSDNAFTYSNLISWALADPSCKAINPETGEVVDAALNKGVYICGKTGTGKSLALDLLRDFACRCKGHGCVFNGNYENLSWQNYRADDIVDRFCEGESLRWMKKATMLGIQDLGSEPTEVIYMGNRHELLRLMLESRADYSTMTFVSSNFPILSTELRQKYGDRVQSRCREMFNYYVLGGEDRRITKTTNK